VRANLPGPVDLGWSDLINHIQISHMSCDHFAMIHEPHVRELGRLLEAVLDVGGMGNELVATGS
jgi:thioesterase domain-containing protein